MLGGFEVISKTTLLIPLTLFTILLETLSRKYFSKLKYTNVIFVNEGGWHFSYLNTPELIEQKLKSYTHHREYELNPIGIENIEKRIKNRESVYNLSSDKKMNQFSKGVKLEIMSLNELPRYISDNKTKYEKWLA